MRCTRNAVLGAIAAALGVAISGLALAQGASYQNAELVLENPEPARSTAARLHIDYVNPADPSAKPPAVAQVVETLPPGSRIDTSVPAACTASDAQFGSMGQSACPAASRVGGGDVDLDSGAGILPFQVTLFNNRDELILLFEQKGGGIRTPSRAKVNGVRAEGPQIIATVPPIPGGPPDGFTAIKRVRLRIEAIDGDGRAYLTTPQSCPAEGGWTSQIEFTYRNGSRQTTTNRSPCKTGAGSTRDGHSPRIGVRGVPVRCASRDFRLRVHIRDGLPLRRAGVRLDGRLLRRTRRKTFGLRVPVGDLPRRQHELTVVASDVAGNRAKRSLRFSRCR